MLTRIEKLRLYIFGDKDTADQDALLELLLSDIDARLLGHLNSRANALGVATLEAIPDVLEHIANELIIARFNRIGAEGLQSQTVDGHSVTFAERLDFSAYSAEIDAYFDDQSHGRTRVVIY